MKPRTVIILWAIAIVLGTTAYFVKFHSSDKKSIHTQLTPGEKILSDLPIRELTSVTLHQGQETTTITRDNNNLWTINERHHYPANHELLRNLLGALGQLRVTQGYPCSPEYFGRFGVSSESSDESDLGLRVSMSDASGATLADVFLGKYNGATRTTMGRFIRIADDHSGVYAAGETFPGVYADPAAWLAPQFFNISNIQSINLTAPSDPEFAAWKVNKASPAAKDQFKLVGMTDQEVMNITSTGTFRSLFAFTTFQDVLSDVEVKKTSNPDAKLKRKVVIQTFDGLTYTITYWPQQTPTKKKNPPTPPQQASYLLTVAITANLPNAKNKAPDESPADAKKRDAAFLAQQQKLKNHITLVQSFHGHTYQVGYTMLEPLQKSRSAFVSTK